MGTEWKMMNTRQAIKENTKSKQKHDKNDIIEKIDLTATYMKVNPNTTDDTHYF